MSAMMRPRTVTIVNYCSSILLILSVQGSKRRSCIDKDPPPGEIFLAEHYGEVGFARDVCVELGRNLHDKLGLAQETKPCAKLASTRTSTCWPCQECRKWQRAARRNADANSDVMAKASAMMQNFINVIAVNNKLYDTADQKFIFGCIEAAIDLLTKSGLTLYSETDEEKVKLINEIEGLKPVFCGDYLKELARKADHLVESQMIRGADHLVESQLLEEADHPVESPRKELPQVTSNTQKEAEEIPENPEADDAEVYQSESSQGTENPDGETDNGEGQRKGFVIRELDIEGSTSPKETEDEENSNGNQNENVSKEKEVKTDEIHAEEKEPDTVAPSDQQKTSNTSNEPAKEKWKMEELPLHKSVFHNEYSKLCTILESGYDVNKKDKHGNTALHLASMLGRRSFVKELLDYGASVRTRNLLGWRAYDEAVSYGDKETVKLMARRLPNQVQDEVVEKRHILLEDLRRIPDFYMELKWEFRLKTTPINFLLPSDKCKMKKRDRSFRIDWSLIGFENMRYKYGDVALLFDGTATPGPIAYFLDMKEKKFIKMDMESQDGITDADVERNAKQSLKGNIAIGTMSTSQVVYTPVMSWWPRNSQAMETIASFKTAMYKLSGLVMKLKTRTEHKPEEESDDEEEEKNTKPDPKSKNTVTETAKSEEKKDSSQIRESNPLFLDSADRPVQSEKLLTLPPPPPTDVTWEQYINAEPGRYPTLAREMVLKEITYPVKESTLGMAQNFPITKEAFSRIVEVVAPFKQFNKWREFMEMKLPPGFPVKLEVPIMMGLSTRMTVLKFQSADKITDKKILDENLFKLPENYVHMTEKEIKALLDPIK